MGYRLTRMTIQGYRGAGCTPVQLDFTSGLVVLFGNNGVGKSTVLSAVEWAIFGDVCGSGDQRQTPTERKKACINRDCESAKVDVELVDDQHCVAISRRRFRNDPGRDEVVVSSDGQVNVMEPGLLIGLTPQVYHRTVAPSQTDLQMLVSDKDEDRDAALERLLGLDHLRTISEGLRKADGALSPKRLADAVDDAQRRLRNPVRERFETRLRRRNEYMEAAWSEAKTRPRVVSLRLCDGNAGVIAIAGEVGSSIEPTTTADALAESALELRRLVEAVCRDPAVTQDLDTLGHFETDIINKQCVWNTARAVTAEANRKLEGLIERYGRCEDNEAELQRVQADLQSKQELLSQLSKRGAVLDKARQWLETQGDGQTECPVCEKPVGVEQLSSLVEAAFTSLGHEVEDLSNAIAALKAEESRLKTVIEELRRAEKELTAAKQNVAAARMQLCKGVESFRHQFLPDQQVKSRLGSVYGRIPTDPINAEDGVLDAALNNLGTLVEAERKKLEEKAAGAARRREALQRRVRNLELLAQFLIEDEKLLEMQLSERSAKLDKSRVVLDEAVVWQDAVKKAKTLVDQRLETVAEEKLKSAIPHMCDWFRSLSTHDSFSAVVAEVNAGAAKGLKYRFRATDGEGWDAACDPDLSGGYRTCLAISALCSLSQLDGSGSPLGFLLLDEPTQHLDPSIRKKLGERLGKQVLPCQLVLSTYDDDFLEGLREGGGDALVIHRFGDWTRAAGTKLLEVK